MIRTLFDRLSGMYTVRWNKAFENPEDIQAWCNVWVLGLEQQGITPAMAQRGLVNCIDMYDWPPSLPEFIRACKARGRDEPVAPLDNPALEYEAKFNPELAAQAAKAVKRPEDETDHLRWVTKILRKYPNGHTSYAYKAALEVAKERGIRV